MQVFFNNFIKIQAKYFTVVVYFAVLSAKKEKRANFLYFFVKIKLKLYKNIRIYGIIKGNMCVITLETEGYLYEEKNVSAFGSDAYRHESVV